MSKLANICAAVLLCLAPLPAIAAPTLYGVAQDKFGAELFAYDMSDFAPGGSLDPKSAAGLDVSGFGKVQSITLVGNTLYALAQDSFGAELLTYNMSDFAPGGSLHPTAGVALNASGFGSFQSISIVGNKLYGLAQDSFGAELLTYDLTKFVPGGYLTPTAGAFLEDAGSGAFQSMSIVGNTLYGLAQTSFSASLLKYDLDAFEPAGVLHPTAGTALFDSGFGKFQTMAIDGSTLYAEAQDDFQTELLSYDLGAFVPSRYLNPTAGSGLGTSGIGAGLNSSTIRPPSRN